MGAARRFHEFANVVKSSVVRPCKKSIKQRFYKTITAGAPDDIFPSFQRWLKIAEQLPTVHDLFGGSFVNGIIQFSRIPALAHLGDHVEWSRHIGYCNLREIAISDRGHFVLVPRLTRPGDYVYRLSGTDTYLVLRRFEDGSAFHLISHCYVEGADELLDSSTKVETIAIR
jgi:hypothetical protein